MEVKIKSIRIEQKIKIVIISTFKSVYCQSRIVARNQNGTVSNRLNPVTLEWDAIFLNEFGRPLFSLYEIKKSEALITIEANHWR